MKEGLIRVGEYLPEYIKKLRDRGTITEEQKNLLLIKIYEPGDENLPHIVTGKAVPIFFFSYLNPICPANLCTNLSYTFSLLSGYRC